MGLLVGFRMIGGAGNDAVTIGHPGELTDFPLGIRERFCLVSCYCEQPQTRLLVVFIDDVRVILILFLFLFGVGLGIGGKESDPFAVGRPSKTVYVALAFRESGGFPSIHSHYVNLLLIIAIRKKGKLFAIGRQ